MVEFQSGVKPDIFEYAHSSPSQQRFGPQPRHPFPHVVHGAISWRTWHDRAQTGQKIGTIFFEKKRDKNMGQKNGTEQKMFLLCVPFSAERGEGVRAPRPLGHTTARELQTCVVHRAPAFKHHQNSTRRPQEGEEGMKIVAGEGKKSDMLGGPAEGGPGEGGSGRDGSGEGWNKEKQGAKGYPPRRLRIFFFRNVKRNREAFEARKK